MRPARKLVFAEGVQTQNTRFLCTLLSKKVTNLCVQLENWYLPKAYKHRILVFSALY
jgi:hypothetical protein